MCHYLFRFSCKLHLCLEQEPLSSNLAEIYLCKGAQSPYVTASSHWGWGVRAVITSAARCDVWDWCTLRCSCCSHQHQGSICTAQVRVPHCSSNRLICMLKGAFKPGCVLSSLHTLAHTLRGGRGTQHYSILIKAERIGGGGDFSLPEPIQSTRWEL